MKKIDDVQFITLKKEMDAAEEVKQKAIAAKYKAFSDYGITYSLYNARIRSWRTDYPDFDKLKETIEGYDKIRRWAKHKKESVLKKYWITYMAYWSRLKTYNKMNK